MNEDKVLDIIILFAIEELDDGNGYSILSLYKHLKRLKRKGVIRFW